MITLNISREREQLRIYINYKLLFQFGRWLGQVASFDDVRRFNKMKEREQMNLTFMPRPLL